MKTKAQNSTLAQHITACGCNLIQKDVSPICFEENEKKRLIKEALYITAVDGCISEKSVFLDEEIQKKFKNHSKIRFKNIPPGGATRHREPVGD